MNICSYTNALAADVKQNLYELKGLNAALLNGLRPVERCAVEAAFMLRNTPQP
jgi:hypothetical protein